LEAQVDVLINNAGISDRTPVTETTACDVRRVFDTNVLGPVRVLHAFTRLLGASSCPVVVHVSSAVGSLAYASNPQGPYAELNLLAYPASKAALNMLTIQWARAHPRWRVELRRSRLHGHGLQPAPGYSDGGGGTDAIVQLATVGSDGPTGIFCDRYGTVPW